MVAKFATFLISFIVIGIAFYALIYMPYEEEFNSKQGRLNQLNTDIAAQQSLVKKHAKVAEYQMPIDTAYEYVKRYLPAENEMPQLVQLVSEIGSKAGLTDGVTLFAPKLPAQVRANYAEIPFTLNLQGEFLTVLAFLYDFSRMDRIVNITDVSIGTPTMIDEKLEILHVNIDCSGSTYRVLTEAEIQAKK